MLKTVWSLKTCGRLSAGLVVLCAASSAQAGVAACYIGKVNDKGEYSDTEYYFLSDGISSGRGLAAMIRQYYREKGVRQRPLCTFGDGNGHYVLASSKKEENGNVIYALGLSPKDRQDARLRAQRLISSRQNDKAVKDMQVIKEGDFGLSDQSAVKVHCSVDRSATVETQFTSMNGVLVGRYNVNGTSVTLNYGKTSKATLPSGTGLPPADIQHTAKILLETACQNELPVPLKRNMIQSLGNWLIHTGHRAIEKMDLKCQDNDALCGSVPGDATSGSRG